MAVIAVTLNVAGRFVVKLPLQIVDDHQIQQAVIIDVHPNTAHRPQWPIFGIGFVETSLGRHIREGAIAVVVVKRIAVNAGDEDVFVPVVVVITDGDTHVIADTSQSGLLGDVREVPLAVVLKKAVRVFRRGLLERLNVRPVGEKDIQLAVVVVVEHGHATDHGFGRMTLGGFATIEREANRLVSKLNGALAFNRIRRSCSLFVLSNARRAGEAWYLGPQRYRYQ